MPEDKQKKSERMKRYYIDHREEIIRKAAQYRIDNPTDKAKEKERHRLYYIEHKEEYQRRAAQYRRYAPDHVNALDKKYRQNVRNEVLRHYANGDPQCARCGFTDIRALSIDHINGNGKARRQETGRMGVAYYRLLKQTGYPEGFQVLCMNCQFIKRHENNEIGISGRGPDRARMRAQQVLLRQKTKMDSTSGYQGVSEFRGRLSSRIGKDGKTYWLGTFRLDQVEEAAKNYDFHAIHLYGRENCFLNFPHFDYSNFVPRRPLAK